MTATLLAERSLEHIRRARRFASYPGDCREMVGRLLVGPDASGLYLTAVSAAYDTETNRTRIGFAFGPVIDDPEVMGPDPEDGSP